MLDHKSEMEGSEKNEFYNETISSRIYIFLLDKH